MSQIKIIGETSEYEGEALKQLQRAASLPSMVAAAGFSDLHPGKGYPIGAAFFSTNMIYPYLLGNDVGCGISLFATTLKKAKFKLEKAFKHLNGLAEPWDGNTNAWLLKFGIIDTTGLRTGLGTIGSGNHFAELQVVEEILNPAYCESAGIRKDNLYLLVHSGSRHHGELLLRAHINKYKDAGLQIGTPEATAYVNQHATLYHWAQANRALIAERLLDQLNAVPALVTDVPHNFVQSTTIGSQLGWLHRKGAAPANTGVVPIPGSRGTLTYLVLPVAKDEYLHSIQHGAGRKWSRADCEDRLKNRYTAESLTRTEIGSRVICEDKQLLYEEAPMAYKNIERGIEAIQQEGLATVVATLRPVLTYKVRR